VTEINLNPDYNPDESCLRISETPPCTDICAMLPPAGTWLNSLPSALPAALPATRASHPPAPRLCPGPAAQTVTSAKCP